MSICEITGETMVDDLENIGMTFYQTEIDKFIPDEIIESQIKILKVKYDLDFEFYPSSVLPCGHFEAPEPAYFGVSLPKDQGYKLNQMMDDLNISQGREKWTDKLNTSR